MAKNCTTPYCTRKPSPGSRVCHTCKSRKHRSRDPVRYAYDTLKANCIRRKGREFFSLTFAEFKEFAIETGYIKGKGKTKTSYSIDRIDNTMGYFIGNIRILTVSENSKKRTKVLVYEYDYLDRKMVASVI